MAARKLGSEADLEYLQQMIVEMNCVLESGHPEVSAQRSGSGLRIVKMLMKSERNLRSRNWGQFHHPIRHWFIVPVTLKDLRRSS